MRPSRGSRASRGEAEPGAGREPSREAESGPGAGAESEPHSRRGRAAGEREGPGPGSRERVRERPERAGESEPPGDREGKGPGARDRGTGERPREQAGIGAAARAGGDPARAAGDRAGAGNRGRIRRSEHPKFAVEPSKLSGT